MRTACLLACAAVLALSHPALALTPAETAQWREDLRFMAETLPATHKNLYHSISPAAFASEVRALDDQLPSLSRAEVIVGLERIVASIGDGHTNIYPTRDPRIGFHTLPVRFTWFEDGLYVRAARPEARRWLGARVVRIGDRSVAEAEAEVESLVGHENAGGARYWGQYLLAMPEVLAALRITDAPGEVPLTLATAAGQERVVLRPDSPVDIMTGDISTLYYLQPGWLDVREASGAPTPPWLRDLSAPFRLEHVGDLLYARINTVQNAPGETLAQFASRLKAEIAATRPAKLAIDLRQNRGGDGTLIPPLIRAIIQSESIDQPGRLFVLIGPATFSAAQMLTDAFETYTNATFVGEPSGSKGNAYGDSRKIVLPNSGITVRASIYYWQDWHPADRRDATNPQVKAPLTFDAYRRGIDPGLAAIEAAAPDKPKPPRAPTAPG